MPVFCRLLLIEDDPIRIDRFRQWVAVDFRLVVATSAGRAIGTLQRDGKATYAGLMLDHDLQQNIATPDEMKLSGSHLVDVIVMNVYHDVPVLIHSMNVARAPIMAERLRRAGFWVTYMPFAHLNESGFRKWATEVHDLWLDRIGE